MVDKKEDVMETAAPMPEGMRPAGQECADFGVDFASFINFINKLRSQGHFTGAIPEEAGQFAVSTKDIADLKKGLTGGRLNSPQDENRRFIPFISVDPAAKKLSLKLAVYDPEATALSPEIKAGLETMMAAIWFINGGSDRRGKYPRVYEFIKSFVCYLNGKIGQPVNPASVKEFMDAVPPETPDKLTDSAYKDAFSDSKIQIILRKMMRGTDNVTATNFGEWMENFLPRDKGNAVWFKAIKLNVARRARERFIKSYMETLRAAMARYEQAHPAEKSMAPLPMTARNQGVGVGNVRTAIAARAAVVKPVSADSKPVAAVVKPVAAVVKPVAAVVKPVAADAKPVEVMPIIPVGADNVCDVDLLKKSQIYVDEFTAIIRHFKECGLDLNPSQNGAIFRLLFDDIGNFPQAKRSQCIELLQNEFDQVFTDVNRGGNEDVEFVFKLFDLRMKLEKRNMRSAAVRAIFMKTFYQIF